MRMNEIIVTLLSAGVIASLVTGIFSILIAIKNNKSIKDLEQLKVHYEKQEELYKTIYSAREELLKALPPQDQVSVSSTVLEKLAFDGIKMLQDTSNVSSDVLEKFASDYFEKLQNLIPTCFNSQNIIWTHFNKYRPYFSEAECEEFEQKNQNLVVLFNKRNDYLNKFKQLKSTNSDLEYRINYFEVLAEIMSSIVIFEKWYFNLLEKYIRSYMR